MRLGSSIVAAAALIVITGCAATGPRGANATGPTLAETIDAQVAREGALVWTPRRLLTWADFKGQPPADAGVVAARTVYSIIDGVRCDGARFEYRVVAVFRPRDSWVQHAILRTPAESVRALRHEQTHFDLSEVHARRLRRYFSELMAPCRMSEDELSAAANRMERDEKAAQSLYDAETDNGRNASRQASWDREVDVQLAALARFAR